MKVKIDLSKDGLAMIFKPYEIMGWDVVWNSSEPIGSGEVWRKVSKALGPGKPISRASVIFFLNRQVDLEFMAWKDGTGKGGYRREYFAKVTMYGLVTKIYQATSKALTTLERQARECDRLNRKGPGMVYSGGDSP